MVKKNWNYTLETNDFSEQMVYPLFILLSDGDWTVSAFCGSPRKKCVGRDVRKMFPYSWKETGYTKAWKEGVEWRCTGVHLAFLLRNAFAFPNLKVVSHVEKKARVASDIFYGIPSPSLDFTFTLDLPDEVVPPRLSTIKNIRLSTSIYRKRLFVPTFLFSFVSMVNNPRTREFRVRGSYRRFKKEISIGWKFYCFRKWRRSDESRRRAARWALIIIAIVINQNFDWNI